jgi:hypothetical protein
MLENEYFLSLLSFFEGAIPQSCPQKPIVIASAERETNFLQRSRHRFLLPETKSNNFINWTDQAALSSRKPINLNALVVGFGSAGLRCCRQPRRVGPADRHRHQIPSNQILARLQCKVVSMPPLTI